MPVPTWAVGQDLLAADVNSWFVPLAAVKSANESVTSSTLLQNDNELLLPVAASATYEWELFADYDGGTQGAADLQWGWAVPAGASMDYTAAYLGTAGTAQVGQQFTAASTPAAGTNGAGSHRAVRLSGIIAVSTTAGNMQWKWAQNTSNATATTVYPNSYLTAVRVG